LPTERHGLTRNRPLSRQLLEADEQVRDGPTGGLTGELTIKGITRPVELDVEFLGQVTDPWDNQRAIFDAQTRINREDWGIVWNMVLDSGGLLVSKEIDLVLHLELVRA
jgi:polyisoprenoid-binding protein YceI